MYMGTYSLGDVVLSLAGTIVKVLTVNLVRVLAQTLVYAVKYKY